MPTGPKGVRGSVNNLALQVLWILSASGCHMLVETGYTPSPVRSASTIPALQVGSFRGEAEYESTPTRIEKNGGDSYELRVPVSIFLREAFVAELQARRIPVVGEAMRVEGQLVAFEFPWVEQIYFPDRAQCLMSFRFTLSDHGRIVHEKTYQQSIDIGSVKGFWGKPQPHHVGKAFVELLKRVFDSFLKDPALIPWFGSPWTTDPPDGVWRSRPIR